MISLNPFKRHEPLPFSELIRDLEAQLERDSDKRRKLIREIQELCRPATGSDD